MRLFRLDSLFLQYLFLKNERNNDSHLVKCMKEFDNLLERQDSEVQFIILFYFILQCY